MARATPTLLVAAAMLVPAAAAFLLATSTPLTFLEGDASGAPHGGTPSAWFAAPHIFDTERAGGEPVIAVTPTGAILVGAHPGWSHFYKADPNLVLPANAQSYLWRSVDGGATWTHLSPLGDDVGQLPGARNVPRNACTPGLSDPDLSVTREGTIYLVDLGPLTHFSVSRSDDDGQTWTCANPRAGERTDRPWIAGGENGRVYTIDTHGGGFRVQRSEDYGATWAEVGNAPCGADLAVDPADGALLVACGPGFGLSTDGGQTWTTRSATKLLGGYKIGAEPAIDSAGNVFMAYPGANVTWTTDRGLTWAEPVDLAALSDVPDGRHIWSWAAAGSEGRAAVAWLASPRPATPDDAREWYVYAGFILNATSGKPDVKVGRITQEPVHVGEICIGTGCALSKSGKIGAYCGSLPDDCLYNPGDRRMGDFFEATVDLNGYLLVTIADTVHASNGVPVQPAGVGHVAFIRQVAGPRLYVDDADVHWYS